MANNNLGGSIPSCFSSLSFMLHLYVFSSLSLHFFFLFSIFFLFLLSSFFFISYIFLGTSKATDWSARPPISPTSRTSKRSTWKATASLDKSRRTSPPLTSSTCMFLFSSLSSLFSLLSTHPPLLFPSLMLCCRSFANNDFSGCIPDFYANIDVDFSGNSHFCSQVLSLSSLYPLLSSLPFALPSPPLPPPPFLLFTSGIHPLLPLRHETRMPLSPKHQLLRTLLLLSQHLSLNSSVRGRK